MYSNPDWAGKPYMPSNGTEGMGFTAAFCDTCIHQHPDPDKKPQCDDVLCEALCGNQPKEWVYNSTGNPTCTKYVNWNWGNNDDDDGYNEPPPPEPDDPNQLCFPWDIMEILEGYEEICITKQAIFEKDLITT